MGGPINFKALALRGRFFGEAEVLSCELFMRITVVIRNGWADQLQSPRPSGLWAFSMASLCEQAPNAVHEKSPHSKAVGLFSLRSGADLNRCTWFCRPLPNRSATRPFFRRSAKISNTGFKKEI
jgi:hypothetical protein